ncbi:MAG: ABC transporter permease [Dysgonamonadaceae bacterium]
MFDVDYWQEIWITITRNKLRSFLTGFGVFWGIFMLVILIGVSNSFKGGMSKIVDGFSPNTCFFWAEQTSEPYKGFKKGRSWDMTNRDLELIRQKAKSVEYISPILFAGGVDKNVVYKHKAASYLVKGVYPENFILERPHLKYGRIINSLDIQYNRKICVIGEEVAKTLFLEGENPVGQNIRVNGIYFQIVGVIFTISDVQIGGSINETVFLPFSTMQKAFNQGEKIHFLACSSKPGIPASEVETEVKTVLKQSHSIAPDDDKAVGGFNIEEMVKIFTFLFYGVDFIAFFVGLGALLSGIIGISNIMMVTVRERTREIGIRRALGAKPFSIVSQIVSESFVLTSLAGIVGFMLGIGLLTLIDQAMTAGAVSIKLFVPPFVSFQTAIFAIFILIVSGVLAGLLPAARALKIKAIDAIREE